MTRSDIDRIVAERVAGRGAASEIAQLCIQEATDMPLEARQAFWERLFGELAIYDTREPPKPAKPAVPVMSDAEAEQFAKSKVPYGCHAGQTIFNTPLKWLDWLIGEERDHFKKQVAAYLARPYVRKCLEEELDSLD